MELILLLILALLPPFLFLGFIMYMDRNEPEPWSLVMQLFLLGAISCLPAIVMEVVLDLVPIFSMGGLAGAALQSFVQISPVEEFFKFAFLYIATWNNRHFTEENDGIVYGGTVALGFAALENVFYVLDSGLAVGIARAMTAIPLHTFTGIIIGYYYGLARFSKEGTRRTIIFKGLLIAWFVHGLYDTLALSESALTALLVLVVIAICITSLIILRRGRYLSLLRSRQRDINEVNRDEAHRHIATADEIAATTLAVRNPNPEEKMYLRSVRTVTATSGRLSLKPFISRTVFALCTLFWGLLVYDFSTSTQGVDTEVIIGGVVLTWIPLMIAIGLEFSWQTDRRVLRNRRKEVQAAQEPSSF